MTLKLDIAILVIFLLAIFNAPPVKAQNRFVKSGKHGRFSSELADNHFNNAIELHRKGKSELASKEYENALNHNRGHIESYINLALIKSESGDKISAINYLYEALKFDPEYSLVHYNLGVIYQEIGRYYLAETEYLSSIKYDDNFVQAYTNLGKIYERLNRPQDALDKYNKAIDINSKYILAKLNIGRLFLSLTMYNKAIFYFTSILEDNPENGTACFYMAVAHYFLKDYSSAWNNVHLAKKFGSPIDQKFLRTLSTVMPEYQNSI